MCFAAAGVYVVTLTFQKGLFPEKQANRKEWKLRI
jgi:hypothetical protein